jgi:ion channel-forming bestrophin family protein
MVTPTKPPTTPRHLHIRPCHCFLDQQPTGGSKSSSSNPLLSLPWAVTDWADAVTERRICDHRPLYDHTSWSEHRSSRQHLCHIISSRVIVALLPPVTAFTAVVATYNTLLPGHALTASPLPYQLTAPVLTLLLVFRTEASYTRFDEGRKVWLRVLVGATELTGMVMPHHHSGSGDDLLRRALSTTSSPSP